MNNYNKTILELGRYAYQRGINYSLTNLQNCLTELKNPEKALKNIIHIAGTNGKGSTLTFIAEGLKESGFSVGTFTSPHLRDYTERIAINFVPISKNDFVKFFTKVKHFAKKYSLTEFEILTVMSILYFAKTKPDYLVYETGLGGRLDATNVLSPILTVITRIDFDHKEILGDTLTKIALEKAKIIKPRIPVITIRQNKKVLEVIKKEVKSNSSHIFIVNPIKYDINSFLLNATYQKENMALSTKALQLLKIKNIKARLRKAQILGRFQIIKKNNRLIILDAGHNPNGIKALIKTLQTNYPGQKFTFLLGISKTKDLQKMLTPIFEIAKKIYFCHFDPKIAYDFAKIKTLFPKKNIQEYKLMGHRILPKEKHLVITGSIYFLGRIYDTL